MGKSKKKGGKPRIVDHISDDSDDEEIDEDEAFNSDDERKYGSFFDQAEGDDDGDSDSDDEGDDDDESQSEGEDAEGDGGQYMLDLLDKIDDNKASNNNDPSKSMAPHVQESPFSASVVPQAGLTLDALLDGLKDTQGFGHVQKTIKPVAVGHATPAPLPKIVAARAERQVHYEHATKDVSKWSKAVQHNATAETLDFRPPSAPRTVTRDTLVESFVPTNEFEQQIHAALQQAGQEEEAVLAQEQTLLDDDLGSNSITMEEFQRRRGQLAKLRHLMFYHEQKRHHINKIKSKQYRRIRKRQRERTKAAETDAAILDNPDLEAALKEKDEVERLRERASLAHKNTSKWAKRVLKRGKNVDVDTRRALSAQLQRGDDLRKRMGATMSRRGNATGNDHDSSEDEEDEDLVRSARMVLGNVAHDESTAAQTKHAKGIFQLSFMQRGVEKQREKAKQEARELLMELEANEDDGLDDDDIRNNDNSDQDSTKKPKAKKKQVASAADMKDVLKEGQLVASALKFGSTTALAMSGKIDVDTGFHDTIPDTASGRVSEHTSTLSTTPVVPTPNSLTKKSKKSATPRAARNDKAASETTKITEDVAVNPWLVRRDEEIAKNDGNLLANAPPKPQSKQNFADVDLAVDMLESTRALVPKVAGADSGTLTGDGKASAPTNNITMLTQEELVAKAFAAPSEQEIDDEFAQEKEQLADREDPNHRKRKKEKNMGSASGWGSWAGQGTLPPSNNHKPRRVPKRLQAPPKAVAKRPRVDAKKPRVILSQSRVKKTAQYMLSEIPYPFTSREEYERSMAGGVGREWNVTSSFKDMTRSDVLTRAGKVIQPISKKVKLSQRGPAKF